MAFNINEELKKLPDKPGVYLMKDDKEQIIYVGKAISLRKRVRQYFQSSRSKSTKVSAMVKNIVEFEYIITDNEVEALILEANLIKKHKPKYNVLLRDDKQYPYIKISINEKYPRVFKTRAIKNKKDKYFGPYTSVGAVNDTLEIIRSLYPIRTCKLNLDNGKINKRPCLNYYIGRCLAPCQGNVDKDYYRELIDEIIMFLNGKEEKLLETIKNKMQDASNRLDFENAAKYRDQLSSLKHILEKQKVVSTDITDKDIIGMSQINDESCIQIFFVRSGKITGREHFIISNVDGREKAEIISSFMKQFYLGAWYLPKEILVEEDFEDKQIIEKWLSDRKGSNVYIKVPKRGEKSHLIKLVKRNALQSLRMNSDRIKKNKQSGLAAINELAEVMNLQSIPRRIEAYDISNIQGMESVGSMVVFEDGIKKSSDYRRFKIKSVVGPDDYSSMEEIITRRFKRGIEERKLIKKNKVKIESFSIFPDLIMMDGGKGQVNIALKVLEKENFKISVCGLVKDDYHKTRGLIYNGKEIKLRANSKAFKLITRIQDEAHRFAISYHRSLRSKKVFKSVLDEINGIGEKRKRALLKEFGSINKIKEAEINELKKVKGMNNSAAVAVYNYFRNNK